MSSAIYDKVISGMRSACDDMLRFSGEPARPLNAEYLFTVAVAKQIDELNSQYGDPYRIYLEKSAKEFSRDCLLPIKFSHPMKGRPSIIRRKPPNFDSGRIDIAVYEDIPNNSYMGHQPICAIELKGFNPARTLVIKDLKRNLKYFGVTGETGGSVLQSTIFAALHYWNKTGSESKEAKRVKDIEDRYKSWLTELSHTSSVDIDVKAHTIRKELVGAVVDEGEYQVLDTDAKHHYVGVVVEFRAKKI